MTACVRCGSETADSALLCQTHTDTLLDTLHAVTSVLEDLEVTYTRMDNSQGIEKPVGVSVEKPLPWNDRIPARANAIRDTMLSWAREVASQTGVTQLPVIPRTRDPKDPTRIPNAVSVGVLAARLLAEHIDSVRRLGNVDLLYTEVLDVVRSGRRAVDRPVDRKYAGQCSIRLDDGELCPTDLYVHPNRRTATCPDCGGEHDVEQRRHDLLNAVHDQLVTYHEAERALPELLAAKVKVSTLRNWVSTGRIVAHGYRHAGTPVQERVHYHDQPLLKVGDIIREVARVQAAQAAAA